MTEENASPNLGQLAGAAPPADGHVELSDADRAELRAVMRDAPQAELGSRVNEFWTRHHAKARGESTGAPDAGPKAEGGQAQDQPDPDDQQQQQQNQDQDQPGELSREDLDAKLAEVSDGKLGVEQLDVIGKYTAPYDRQLQNILDTQGEDAFVAALEKGQARTLAQVYGGSERAMADGVAEISRAAEKIGGAALIEEINSTQVLTDPDIHQQVLTLARVINGSGAGGE